MIKIQDLSYKYKNGKQVLENINLEIKERRNSLHNWKKWIWEIYTWKINCWNYKI